MTDRGDEERQVRSYHKAFDGELLLYSLGNDLRLWRPLPARQIFWTGGVLATVFVATRVLGVHVPVWSMGWFFVYFAVPGGLGWLFTRALVEGRRLHVVIASWVRHALYGRHLVGGHRRAGRNRSLRATRVRVEAAHRTRRPIPVRYAAATTAVLLAAAVVALGTGPGRPSTPRPGAIRRVGLTVPRTVPAPRIVRIAHVVPPRRAPHPRVRRRHRQAVRERRRAVSRPSRRSAPSVPPPRVVVRPSVPAMRPVEARSPAATVAPPPPPTSSTTPPASPSCFPGQLGCNG